MNEKPHKDLLDRDLWPVLMKEKHGPTLDLLQEVLNYGTNLIARCFSSSPKKTSDIVVIVLFLKHAVTLGDAVHVLVSRGAVKGAFIPLRGMLEVALYLEWILTGDTERRARLYYVWDRRQERYWARALKSGTTENELHREHMKDAPYKMYILENRQDELDDLSTKYYISTTQEWCTLHLLRTTSVLSRAKLFLNLSETTAKREWLQVLP